MTRLQQNPRRILFSIVLILGLAWVLISADNSSLAAPHEIAAPHQGFIAPDFDLNTPAGESVRLSELRGTAILINLWATWCPPCRAEMQTIETLYNEYKAQGFTVLAVNMTYQDDPFAIMPFVTEQALTFPILLDETGGMAGDYQLRSLPSSFFVDRTGVIKEVVIGGPMAEALLRTRIENILR